MSGDIFGHHERRELLVSSRWRPRNILQCTGQSPYREPSLSNVSSVEVEERAVLTTIGLLPESDFERWPGPHGHQQTISPLCLPRLHEKPHVFIALFFLSKQAFTQSLWFEVKLNGKSNLVSEAPFCTLIPSYFIVASLGQRASSALPSAPGARNLPPQGDLRGGVSRAKVW